LSRSQIVPDDAAEGRDEWDRHWALYGEPAEGNPANNYRHRLVMALLGHPGAGDTIFDIGSGQGELAMLLQERFPEAAVKGIEYSAEGVQRARTAAEASALRIEFILRDLLEPATVGPTLRSSATFAVCSEVLEHVDDPGLLLRNAAAYLAPGCRLVVTVPGGPRSAFDRHIGHRRHFAPAGLRHLLEGAGFEVEHVARAGFPFFNLYRLAVIARGRRLIADLERAASSDDGGAGATTQGAVLAFFDRAFRLNMASSPFGWQMVAVGRYVGTDRVR
jgi:SAM-dependent methyltransferase